MIKTNNPNVATVKAVLKSSWNKNIGYYAVSQYFVGTVKEVEKELGNDWIVFAI